MLGFMVKKKDNVIFDLVAQSQYLGRVLKEK